MGNTQTIKWDPQFFLDLTHPTIYVLTKIKRDATLLAYILAFRERIFKCKTITNRC